MENDKKLLVLENDKKLLVLENDKKLILEYIIQSSGPSSKAPELLKSFNYASPGVRDYLSAGYKVLKACAQDPIDEIIELISKHHFTWEHLGDSALLKSREIWEVIVNTGLPTTAMLKNLGRLTSLKVLESPLCLEKVMERFTSEKAIKAARLHPIVILDALRVYESGQGDKGSLKWVPLKPVLDALEIAFYLAFKKDKSLESVKKVLIGVDVSGSMDGPVNGMLLSARDAAAAMIMGWFPEEEESRFKTMAFSSGFQELHLKKGMKLKEVKQAMSNLFFDSTDCAMPMVYALQKKIPVDLFVVMTDNETYYGNIHPMAALRKYRKEMNMPNTKLAVIAFSATDFTIADPDDPLTLDIAGLDSAVPRILDEFERGI